MYPSFTLQFPGGYTATVQNQPGVTFIVGANGTGKSYALKRLAEMFPQSVLYIPAERDILRQGVPQQPRIQEEVYNSNFDARDQLSRLWSRALRSEVILELATALVQELGLPQRITISPAAGSIVPESRDLDAQYDARDEGNGVVHIPTLGLAIYDPAHPVVVLDEPENALYPQALHVLLQVLRAVAERQEKHFIIITHAPLLLDLRSLQDLTRVLFVRRPDAYSHQRTSFAISAEEAAYFEPLLPLLNAYKREAYFAEVVILVEGRTDRDFLTELLHLGNYDRSLGRTTVLPLEGCGDAGKYAGYFRTIGVRPVVLLDRDVVYPTSKFTFRVGTIENGSFQWSGWVAPTNARDWLNGSPLVDGEGPSLAGQFQELNEALSAVRTSLTDALTAVTESASCQEQVPSLTGIGSAHPGTTLRERYRRLMDAALCHNDWERSCVAETITVVRDAWRVLSDRALELGVIVLPCDSLEDLYRSAHRGPSKAERLQREIAYLRKNYRNRSGDIQKDYEDVLDPLERLNVIEQSRGGLPRSIATRLHGVVLELWTYLFAEGDPASNLRQLESRGAFDRLSPGTSVKDHTAEEPPWVELKVPLFRGYLSEDGTLRLESTSKPDVYSTLMS